MMRKSHPTRRAWVGGAALAVTLAGTLAFDSAPARAQAGGATAAAPSAATPMSQQPLPQSVLLFPAVVTAENGAVAPDTPAVRQTREIVTDAIRKYLAKGGVGVVVYNPRLPSIERAVNEGGTLKKEDALKGPGDDTRLARQMADVIGANEFVTVSVDNYSWDPATRRATFNLSLFRNAADGGALASAAEKAVGEAPADVAAPRREGSAVARAADFVAQKSVIAVYPQSAVIINPPPAQQQKKRKRNNLAIIIPAAALGAFLLIPR